MDGLFKTLYEKFFMQDLLGKIAPGSLATIAIICAIKGQTPLQIFLAFRSSDWKVLAVIIVLGVPFFYMAGVGLQIAGELIGLQSPSPYPQHILTFPLPKQWKMANAHFEERLAIIETLSDYQWTSGATQRRERFVYLKEGSGNMALALLVFSLCLPWISTNPDSLFGHVGLRAILPFTAIILYVSHLIHARRQAAFEINVMDNLIQRGDTIPNCDQAKVRLMREALDLGKLSRLYLILLIIPPLLFLIVVVRFSRFINISSIPYADTAIRWLGGNPVVLVLLPFFLLLLCFYIAGIRRG